MGLMNPKQVLFDEISAFIEKSKHAVYAQVNSTTVMLFWRIRQRISNEILKNKRADYGKQIVVTCHDNYALSSCSCTLHNS